MNDHEHPSAARRQAALRRVATLVAQGVSPNDIVQAVTVEIGQLLGADGAMLLRYGAEDTMTMIGGWSRTEGVISSGTRHPIDAGTLGGLIFDTGRPGRIDSYEGIPGSIAVLARQLGWRSAVGAPIIVDGRVWGAFGVATMSDDALPPDTEQRLAQLTELVAIAIVSAQSRAEITRLADEQAALRRVATLVAGGAPPADVFAGVAHEVAHLMHVPILVIGRYDDDDLLTIVADSSDLPHAFQPGTSWTLVDASMAMQVRETGGPARIDDYGRFPPDQTRDLHASQIEWTAGAPIVVDGEVWGVMGVASNAPPAFDDVEHRLAEFTALVGTALGNTQARDTLRRLAQEQAALRRVATLVAERAPPARVFEAVCAEVGRLIPADGAALTRYEADGTLTTIASWTTTGGYVPSAMRLPIEQAPVSSAVHETARPHRIDNWDAIPGEVAARGAAAGWRSAVAVPLIVSGRPWGTVIVMSKSGQPMPPDTEARLTQFTDLAATAIADAESRAELAASRARIITTADATRRRIERDLHDGVQQQLLSIALELRNAQAGVPPELDQTRAQFSRAVDGLTNVLDELREIAHGIHPAILAQGGLGPALKTLGRRSPVPVQLEFHDDVKLPERVEVAAYYVVAEALANAAKYAQASAVRVEVQTQQRNLRVSVRDDGLGGANPSDGSGLTGLKDRAEALGGAMTLHSPPGGGTTLQVELPLEQHYQ